jgi:repressor LexA
MEVESPKLTARQQQILDLVQSAIERTGAPPTRAEIANELGFKSANAAEEHLQALARKGVIELVGGTSRGIRLKSDTLRALNEARGKQYSLPLPSLAQLSLPLVGRVADGWSPTRRRSSGKLDPGSSPMVNVGIDTDH